MNLKVFLLEPTTQTPRILPNAPLSSLCANERPVSFLVDDGEIEVRALLNLAEAGCPLFQEGMAGDRYQTTLPHRSIRQLGEQLIDEVGWIVFEVREALYFLAPPLTGQPRQGLVPTWPLLGTPLGSIGMPKLHEHSDIGFLIFGGTGGIGALSFGLSFGFDSYHLKTGRNSSGDHAILLVNPHGHITLESASRLRCAV